MHFDGCIPSRLAGMRRHIAKGRTGVIPEFIHKNTMVTEVMCMNRPHVTICLLGKFKGETGVDHHLITVANKTMLGLRPRWWLEKLIEVCEGEGGLRGQRLPHLMEPCPALPITMPCSGSTSRRYRRRPI